MSEPFPFAADRAGIDELDRALLELLARRRAVVKELFARKLASGLPLIDPVREEALAAEWRSRAALLGVPEELAADVLAAVLADSHREARGGGGG